MFLIPVSILVQFLLFNKIGKLTIRISFFLAFYRSVISFLYTTIFPLNDLTNHYYKNVENCNFDIYSYTKNFFFYTSPANRIYCSFPELSISALNLFYSTFAAIFIALFISLLSDPKTTFNKNLKNKIYNNRFKKLKNYLFLFFLFDPALVLFTSAIGKDVIQFCFYVSIILFVTRFNFKSLICFLIMILFINYSRAYVFLFAASALFLAYFLPDIKLSKSILPVKAIFKFSSKIKLVQLMFFATSIFIVFFVFQNYLLGVLVPRDNAQIDVLNFQSFATALEYYTLDPGGNFAYPDGSPLLLKYIFFWILPFPGFQTLFSSFVFGSSTIFMLFLIYQIFRIGLVLNKFYLKFLFASILVFSILFGVVSNNSGLTIRYRTTTLLPAIYLIFHIACQRSLSALDTNNKKLLDN